MQTFLSPLGFTDLAIAVLLQADFFPLHSRMPMNHLVDRHLSFEGGVKHLTGHRNHSEEIRNLPLSLGEKKEPFRRDSCHCLRVSEILLKAFGADTVQTF